MTNRAERGGRVPGLPLATADDPVVGRSVSGVGRLARMGFADASRACDLLGADGLGWWNPAIPGPADQAAERAIADLLQAADPDLALMTLHRLAAADTDRPALMRELADDHGMRRRLFAVLGASTALGDHLVANPGEWRLFDSAGWQARRPTFAAVRRILLDTVGVPPDAPPTWGTGGGKARGHGPDVVADFKRAYRRCLLRTVARDLTWHGAPTGNVADVSSELAELAVATVQAALAVAAAGLPDGAPPARLAVIGMGKCGARELNYVSDVDVVFVAEPGPPPAASTSDRPAASSPPDSAAGAAGSEHVDVDPTAALRSAGQLAAMLMRVCSSVAWPVDAALRPEGKDGPLVRTVASFAAYYKQWAKTWEFQALLKARPVAGDTALGDEWMALVTPLIWSAADRPNVVSDVQAMRRRVETSLPAKEAAREIKLGPGGLRDIEFAVQLLQLVHGRGDETLRSGATLEALAALTADGYVGRADGEALAQSYRFLRTVEHRLQLQRLRRTHRLPTDQAGLRWLAASLGYRGGESGRDAVEAFTTDWSRHAREVRRLHQKLFYRPLLAAVAQVPGPDLRLTPQSAKARLEVLGFRDPAAALRQLEALTAGVSRRAHLQRALLPALLQSFADAPDPDAGLLAYRVVSDKLGRTPWYLRLLRDEGQVAVRLPALLGTSRYVADLLGRDPEGLRLLADDAELVARDPASLRAAMTEAAGRHADPAAATAAVRAMRRRELLRTACADLLGLAEASAVGTALSDVTDAVLAAALEAAQRSVEHAQRSVEHAQRSVEHAQRGRRPMRMAVIGMGRLGGAEMSYSSDADVMFVYEAVDGASETAATAAARAVAEELRRLLNAPAPDPPLGIDANLRPEGRQGPLVRSFASYREYYRRWSSIWEAQALLRARPVAGDAELGERFLKLIEPLRYPDNGLTTAQVIEIRRIKARVDLERLPRGADPATHTKLGRGGLADVEWTVQLLQLRHAGVTPGLRTPRTLEGLTAARDAGLVTPADSDAMAAAWTLATRVRNAIMLVRGRPSDQLPRSGAELVGVIGALGFPIGADQGEFVDYYLRTMRRGRQAVERVFHA